MAYVGTAVLGLALYLAGRLGQPGPVAAEQPTEAAPDAPVPADPDTDADVLLAPPAGRGESGGRTRRPAEGPDGRPDHAVRHARTAGRSLTGRPGSTDGGRRSRPTDITVSPPVRSR